jgi:hypothetical protein
MSMVFSTNKTDRHDIPEILLKVALNTITPNSSTLFQLYCDSRLIADWLVENMNLDLTTQRMSLDVCLSPKKNVKRMIQQTFYFN